MIKLLKKQEEKDCKSYTFTINDQMNFQILVYNSFFSNEFGDELCLNVTFYNTNSVYSNISILFREGFFYEIAIRNNGLNTIHNDSCMVNNEKAHSFSFPVRRINDICLCIEFDRIAYNSSKMRKTMGIIETICKEMDEVEHFIKTEFLEKYI